MSLDAIDYASMVAIAAIFWWAWHTRKNQYKPEHGCFVYRP